MAQRMELSGRADISERNEMADWHQMIESVLLRAALTGLFGLVGWAATVVVIGLVTGAARGLVDAPPLVWASENATVLALAMTAIGWAWLRFRPHHA